MGASGPAYQRLAERIEAMITAGEIRPGQQLPTETELSAQFGVNRSTVREAIRSLEQAGIVKRAGAKRLHACLPHFQELGTRMGRALVLHKVSFRELWEVTIGLEPMTVSYAVERLRPSHLDALARNLAEMEMALTDAKEVVRLDIEFHNLIAEATENRVLILAREPMSLLFYPSVGYLLESLKPAARRLLDAHRRIFDHLERREREPAAQWMHKHIVDFKRGYELAGLDMDRPFRPWKP